MTAQPTLERYTAPDVEPSYKLAEALHERGLMDGATFADVRQRSLMTDSPTPESPHVLYATVREAGATEAEAEWHVECRWSDGDKGASIVVDYEREALADEICRWLNERAEARKIMGGQG